MKTLKLFIAAIILTIGSVANAQTVLVGPINTYKVSAHSSTAAKMVRMELVKTNKYNVLDEFDMYEVENPAKYDECYSKNCLVEYGKELDADLVVSGSVDKIGAKIIISLKLIDVNSAETTKTVSDQFDDQEGELQRMLLIMVQKLVGIEPDPELYKQLTFKNELITSNNVGRVNNSGPRMGIAIAHGSAYDFMIRPESQGGLDMVPVMSNIGYQFEVQYVGTENFSSLFEIVPSFNGLEQGKFLPSLTFMNGFRFGQQGWEFAFGPTFGLKKTSFGFFDTENVLGLGEDIYYRQGDLTQFGYEATEQNVEDLGYEVNEHLDNRGGFKLSTRWTMAFGRTFKSGALNIPINLFYSGYNGGGFIGASVGFNITRKKKSINK